MNASINTTPVAKLLAVPTQVILIGGGKNNPAHPQSAPTTHYTLESLKVRAETITPVLRGIPDFEPPPKWGINE